MLQSNASRIVPWGTLAKILFHWMKELFVLVKVGIWLIPKIYSYGKTGFN